MSGEGFGVVGDEAEGNDRAYICACLLTEMRIAANILRTSHPLTEMDSRHISSMLSTAQHIIERAEKEQGTYT